MGGFYLLINKKKLHYVVFFLILLTLFSPFLIRCNDLPFNESEVVHIFTDRDIINQTRLFKKVEKNDNISFNAFYKSIDIPDGGELGGITAYGNILYYIIDYRNPMSNNVNSTEIYSYNWEESKKEKLYTINDPSIAIVNELQADENSLYWSYFDKKEYKLVEFSLNTKTLNYIYSASFNQIPIVLGQKGDYLSWYMYDNVKNKFNLNTYNPHIKKLSTINLNGEDLKVEPYDRPSLSGTEVLLLQKNDKDIFFLTFEEENKHPNKIFQVSSNLGNCFRPQISNNKIVWMDQLGKEIYYYDRKDNTLSYIDIKHFDISIFSMNLIEDYLFIVNRNSDIVYLDLNNKTYVNFSDTFKEVILQNEFPGKWDYGYSHFTRDNKILSEVLLDNKNQALICIIKGNK